MPRKRLVRRPRPLNPKVLAASAKVRDFTLHDQVRLFASGATYVRGGKMVIPRPMKAEDPEPVPREARKRKRAPDCVST
ncbi:hypothetical protein AA103196_2289 [Ameyamaea chiangmaiensis NBRC 103196]|uniref:Uncharacterized protein n=1 Tax=Ameyamaea chiangmaiensis TaxID=442969 RepID=A0A850P9N5_9PROT|nr:hypothetical protein [Ameyamaea chiangmaiensis]MBS4075452.1 hypothetical protein [Ameyamaea chiangmaiensis]NVN39016.1 hypothetical protein [Ameyamaea chiangmaiensis]GBQ69712.1 hypothetical protein AA103196_2289 [Ameyamaea chiangmaiensis NBRC 103196]